jgi:hypothetical protein
MAAFHQMGHDSKNLILEEDDLVAYRGAILSPVNEVPTKMAELMAKLKATPSFETIFDPQLYFPKSEREKLRTWPYFPQDVDTADTANDAWWQGLTDRLLAVGTELEVNAICSPVQVPSAYTNAYYAASVQTARYMHERLEQGKGRTRGLQTAVVNLPDLVTTGRAQEIASIVSQTAFDRVYVIFAGGSEPRNELDNADQLKGAMRLISDLKAAELRVLVGYSSTDVVLWKSAGAHDCASGKFFNLRRFGDARFDDPSGGGGQLPYLVEENLLAFLRESDVARLAKLAILGEVSEANPYFALIMDAIAKGEPWVALGWRFYLYWFADAMERIENGLLDVRKQLKEAEDRWKKLEDDDELLEERRNDGNWLRSWRRALNEYAR